MVEVVVKLESILSRDSESAGSGADDGRFFNKKSAMKRGSTNIETSYKGWIDELTYAPTKPGVGLAMYVWTRHIGTNKPDLNSEQFYHPNLAKLLGYYLNEHKLSCVYELSPSLAKILFGG
ncbi:putative transferase [Helianthus debilis subsp. tardiflorus]